MFFNVYKAQTFYRQLKPFFYDIKNGMMPTGKSIFIRSVKGAILMTGTNKSLNLKVVQLVL